ncbi:MAG: dockerin type I domain-containing protein [Porcipelethomonas sp.]
MRKLKRLAASFLAAAVTLSGVALPSGSSENLTLCKTSTVSAAETLTIADLPDDYKYAADWIWENRITAEKSTERRNTLFDQIIAGQGTINYVVRWQSYKTISLEQRQKLQTLVSDCINDWNDCLAGYENWPYDHIDVKITGWAVLDENTILDRQPDEIIYTNLTDYDSTYDTSNGYETIPDKLPNAPDELSRMYHFEHENDPGFNAYDYPGGLDKRFDMYLWATQGFPDIGGCGGDWGQRLSDNAYLNMLDGTNIHVLEHEIGHGFGMTDFYGGEGESDGFPPGGFPGGENSIMMAGSASKITDFDQWMLRYMWTEIKDDEERFDIQAAPEPEINPGDVNDDGVFDAADAAVMQKWLVKKGSISAPDNGDMNSDGRLNVIDLVLMRRMLTGTINTESSFINAPIKTVGAYLPSQGDGNLVIFYVDFPDCTYDYAPSEAEIYEIAFGSEDTSDANYPFESMSAFYSRSSKGALNLKGSVFRYTAKENQSAYDTDKAKLAMECYSAFEDSEDFTKYDGNGDGYIDATLFTVPTKAGDTDWWPCAGPLGRDEYSVDGMKIGHIITGNAQIESQNDYYNFNSSYLHEMGHCMGLPDYYLFSGGDGEGMHGYAGSELMDMDATTDFSAFSKLQLGWFRENQVNFYDSSKGTQTFTLNNAQTDSGNCIIIPNGSVDGQYQSEYFIIEYSTDDRNNSNPQWFQKTADGIRIYHIDAEIFDNGYWKSYKYASGSEFTNNDNGRRLIRLVNEADDNDTDNFFRSGDVINSSINGFAWYDSSDSETVAPGVTITVGSCVNDTYEITIENHD